MEHNDFIELYYYDFSQLSLIEGGNIPKTKKKYTKTFKNTLLNTDNTFTNQIGTRIGKRIFK